MFENWQGDFTKNVFTVLAIWLIFDWLVCYFGYRILDTYNPKFNGAKNDAKRTAVAHMMRCITECFITISTIGVSYRIVPLFVEGVPFDDFAMAYLRVGSCGIVAMYYTELIYRSKISLVSVAHHLVTLANGVILLETLQDDRAYAKMAFVYGIFIAFEWPEHLLMVLYRSYDNKRILKWLFLGVSIQELVFKIVHQIFVVLVYYFEFANFSTYSKASLPISFLVWVVAQFYGPYVLYKIYLSLRVDVIKERLELYTL